MATISVTGTWTAPTTTLPPSTGPNTPFLDDVSLDDFRDGPSTEVTQFIELMSTNLGTTYWGAANHLRAQLTALFNGSVPTGV